MNLNWNIKYQIVSKYIYPVNAELIFEIPTQNDIVYMRQNLLENLNQFIVLLDTQKFIQVWSTSKNDERFPNYHLGNETIWRSDRKFHDAEQGFSAGIKNPVPIPSNISCRHDETNLHIEFSNDFTRTIWLLANHAEYFPIAVRTFEMAKQFHQFVGRTGCAIHATNDIYQQWWLQNQHLFPKVPDNLIE